MFTNILLCQCLAMTIWTRTCLTMRSLDEYMPADIDVTLLLLTWYRLFRRCDPPKDEEDINELQELAHWYLNLSKFI